MPHALLPPCGGGSRWGEKQAKQQATAYWGDPHNSRKDRKRKEPRRWMNRSVADFSDPSAFRTYVLDASWLQPLLNAGPCKKQGVAGRLVRIPHPLHPCSQALDRLEKSARARHLDCHILEIAQALSCRISPAPSFPMRGNPSLWKREVRRDSGSPMTTLS